MEYLVAPLGFIMRICFDIFNDYGIAIIVFTVITKLVTLPVSVWVQKNSIKMIKMQPEINQLKAKFFGDGERIAEHQALIFKREKYNPFASIIPLMIQIVLLIGVIEVIYRPLTFLLGFSPETINELVNLTASLTSSNPEMSSIQISVLTAINNPEYYSAFLGLDTVPNIETVISSIKSFNTNFLLFDLSLTPSVVWGISTAVPFLAALSSWLMCYFQNKENVLQSEQSSFNKNFTLIISVGLSLYLGLFVPAGVALYWITGNLVAILTLYFLNFIINPKKYIDYQALEQSRKQLDELNNLGVKKRNIFKKDKNAAREKQDYKRFFSVANKKLVFYSEGNGFYKYYKGIIEYILNNSNIVIHYITRDPYDDMFERTCNNPRIKAYYIGDRKLITLFMKMDSEIVVSTTPDIETYHLKRSYVKKDIEYIFTDHGFGSSNLLYKKNALAYFDTVFCLGQYQVDELKAQEKLYNTPAKKLVEAGYCLIDDMIDTYNTSESQVSEKPTILIAPSWQKDNIMDLCFEDILDNLCDKSYNIIVRPHPQYIRLFPQKIELLLSKYHDKLSDSFKIETDFSKNSSVFNSDIVLTDWSAIAYEFSFTTNKPSIFIETPMKVMNLDWEQLGIEPIDFKIRKTIGRSVPVEDIGNISAIVADIINNGSVFANQIELIKNESIFNLGKSGEIGGKYIINALIEKQKMKKDNFKN